MTAAPWTEDFSGFSLKTLVDRATRCLEHAKELERLGDLQGAYDMYEKWAKMLSACLAHAEFRYAQRARDSTYLQFQKQQELFQPTHARIRELKGILGISPSPSSPQPLPLNKPQQAQAAPQQSQSPPSASSSEEQPKRRSIADRMAALSHAGVNTSTTAPQVNGASSSSSAGNSNARRSQPLEHLREEQQQQQPPESSEPQSTPDNRHRSRPLPTVPDLDADVPQRPSSQPTARSAVDEQEQVFHSHFPTVDALESRFPALPDGPSPKASSSETQPAQQAHAASTSVSSSLPSHYQHAYSSSQDHSYRPRASPLARRPSADSESKRQNRKATIAQGDLYGTNIARNVGDVIGRPGTSGGPPARGSQTDHSHNRGPLGPLPYPSSSSTSGSMPYPSSSTSGPTFSTPPVAFPPTALSKFSPPPISYSTPQAPYDSANSSFSSMHGSMPPALSPNSSFSNHLNGSPYTMPTTTSSSSSPSSNISRSAMAPISYPNVGPSSQQTSGTDLRRPPLAAQPNSFTRGSSYYDQQPQNRRLSQLHYSPSGPTGSPQWLDGTVGITGLKNLGNTCYMNSTLQCLSATIPFAKFFTGGAFRKQINTVNPLGTKGQLANTLCQLFQVLWSEQYQFVSPVSFRDAICHFASQFRGTEQHDSQEFLAFLLDGLHEDLNMVKVKPKGIELTPEQEAKLESLPAAVASHNEWERYLMRDNSLIVQWFQGQYRNRLQCLTCGKTSTTYNPFMYLSLPLPSRPSKVTLDQCLDAFVQEEILDKGNAWNCPGCRAPRKASKRLTIARLPPILLIHLKRFAFRGPFSERIDTAVQFPVYGLDLSRYLPVPAASDNLYSSQGSGSSAAPGKAYYDLYSISQHFGSLSSGHYTAIVRSRNEWNHVGDSRVTRMDESEVRKAQKSTYILFYRLRQ